jgi:hypothetical protein
MSAGDWEWDDYPIADLEVGHLLADLYHFSHELMS